jgi:hypothetical protein
VTQPRTPDPGVDAIYAVGYTIPGWGSLLGDVATDTGAAGAARTIVEGAGDVTDAARAVRRWISDRHNWARIGWFAAGVALFTIGAVAVAARPATKAVNAVAAPIKAAKSTVRKAGI